MKPIIVSCGDCDEPLLEVVVKPGDILWKIVAHCPICSGKSYKKSFQGLIAIAQGEHVEISHDETIDDITHFYLVEKKQCPKKK